MDLDAPPMHSASAARSKPQLSVLIPPKADNPNSQESSPRRNQRFRNSMKSPTTFNQAINEGDEREPESPGSGTKRKMQQRVSCVPTFPLHNLQQVMSLDKPSRANKSRTGTEIAGHSMKEIGQDQPYNRDRLTKHFEEKYLKKQKEFLRTSWRRTTQMAAFIGKMQTMQKGTQILSEKSIVEDTSSPEVTEPIRPEPAPKPPSVKVDPSAIIKRKILEDLERQKNSALRKIKALQKVPGDSLGKSSSTYHIPNRVPGFQPKLAGEDPTTTMSQHLVTDPNISSELRSEQVASTAKIS